MLERLVAAVIVIGAVLWGASILASPGDDATADAPRESGDDPGATAPRDTEAPILNDEGKDEDDDEGEERGEGKGKRKKGRDGGD